MTTGDDRWLTQITAAQQCCNNVDPNHTQTWEPPQFGMFPVYNNGHVYLRPMAIKPRVRVKAIYERTSL